MKIAILAAYIALIVAGLTFAIKWSKRKKLEYRDLRTRQKLTPMQALLAKPLSKGWYVSIEFCVGFAIAALFAVVLLKAVGFAF